MSARGVEKRGWIALLVFVLGMVVPASARAQIPGEEIARQTFEDGVVLEKKGDYIAALAKFRESMEIKPTLGNRFHLAFCLEMTGKLASALNEYEIVDRTARDQNKQDVIAATRKQVEPLRPRVPQLALRIVPTTPKDAEVSLDGKVVPPLLLDGKMFRIDPGEHTITGRAPEHDTFTKLQPIAEGSTNTVEIVLQPTARAAPVTQHVTEPPREEPRRKSRVLPIATTAGAVVLAAGGVVAFLVADGANSDAERTCPTRLSCDDERDKVRTFDALALGTFIGAAGLGALSIVLWTAKDPSSHGRSKLDLYARPSSIGLEGRF